MMIRGNWIDNKGVWSRFPDMGYSFCNCRNIFFTKWENVTRGDDGLNSSRDPLGKLQETFKSADKGSIVKITMRDPYFIIWSHPHDYTGFNPRVNFILWDAESFIKECTAIGFELVEWHRDMDVESATPECYHVTLRVP